MVHLPLPLCMNGIDILTRRSTAKAAAIVSTPYLPFRVFSVTYILSSLAALIGMQCVYAWSCIVASQTSVSCSSLSNVASVLLLVRRPVLPLSDWTQLKSPANIISVGVVGSRSIISVLKRIPFLIGLRSLKVHTDW
jgi:hypothetical protein